MRFFHRHKKKLIAATFAFLSYFGAGQARTSPARMKNFFAEEEYVAFIEQQGQKGYAEVENQISHWFHILEGFKEFEEYDAIQTSTDVNHLCQILQKTHSYLESVTWKIALQRLEKIMHSQGMAHTAQRSTTMLAQACVAFDSDTAQLLDQSTLFDSIKSQQLSSMQSELFSLIEIAQSSGFEAIAKSAQKLAHKAKKISS